MAIEMIPRPRAVTMRTALFDPGMVIGPGRLYWIAGTLLIFVGLIISALPFLLMMRSETIKGFMQASMLGQISYVLIFPWFCLLGGRLRDAGFNPISFIAILIGWSLISSIIMAILMFGALLEDMPNYIESIEANAEPKAVGDLDAMMEMQGEIMITIFRKIFWPVHIVYGLSSFAVLGLMALMPRREVGNLHLWKRGYVPPPASPPAT